MIKFIPVCTHLFRLSSTQQAKQWDKVRKQEVKKGDMEWWKWQQNLPWNINHLYPTEDVKGSSAHLWEKCFMSQINLPLRHNASLTFKSNILSWKLLKPYSSVLFKSQNRFTFCYALRRLLSEILLYRSNQNDCTNQKGYLIATSWRTLYLIFFSKHRPFLFRRNLFRDSTLLGSLQRPV